MYKLTVILALAASNGNIQSAWAQPPASGSYWAVYNISDPAEDSCNVTTGMSIEDSCCTVAPDIPLHDALKGNATCFSLGPGLIPFSGCVGDGVAGYGENCDGGDGVPPFVAKDAAECGCDFSIEGSGCYKANDIPGQQWFVFLDGVACKKESSSSGKGKSSSSSMSSSGKGGLSSSMGGSGSGKRGSSGSMSGSGGKKMGKGSRR